METVLCQGGFLVDVSSLDTAEHTARSPPAEAVGSGGLLWPSGHSGPVTVSLLAGATPGMLVALRLACRGSSAQHRAVVTPQQHLWGPGCVAVVMLVLSSGLLGARPGMVPVESGREPTEGLGPMEGVGPSQVCPAGSGVRESS